MSGHTVLSTLSGRPVAPTIACGVLTDGARFFVAESLLTPVRSGDIVIVAPLIEGLRGHVALATTGDTCTLVRLVRRVDGRWLVDTGGGAAAHTIAAEMLVGWVRRVEQGEIILDLDAPAWRLAGHVAAMSPRFGGRVLRTLAALERVRRPLFPPVFLGSAGALERQVLVAYEAEAALWVEHDGFRPEEAELVRRYVRPDMRILDVGCGGGREARAFARSGAQVHAIDTAKAVVDAARDRAHREGLSITFDTVVAPDAGRFDVVYLAPGTYAHVVGRERRARLVRALEHHVRAGGRLVIAVEVTPPEPRWARARLVDLLRRLAHAFRVRASEPGDRYERGFALVPPPGSFRFVHRFGDPQEIRGELAAAGVALETTIDDRLWISEPTAGR